MRRGGVRKGRHGVEVGEGLAKRIKCGVLVVKMWKGSGVKCRNAKEKEEW